MDAAADGNYLQDTCCFLAGHVVLLADCPSGHGFHPASLSAGPSARVYSSVADLRGSAGGAGAAGIFESPLVVAQAAVSVAPAGQSVGWHAE